MSKFPAYTYLIGWSYLNIWYYGVRYANKTDPGNDFWVKYFSSSIYVKMCRDQYGEPDVRKIRKIFNDPSKAMAWENRVLNRLNVINEDKWLNRINFYPNWMSYKRKGNYYCNDGVIEKRIPKNTPLPTGFTKGRLPNRTPDPGWNSVTVKDSLGNKFRISKDDPRYISGEVDMINKGQSHNKETRKSFASKIQHECPNCGATLNSGNLAHHNKFCSVEFNDKLISWVSEGKSIRKFSTLTGVGWPTIKKHRDRLLHL
jgi:endogenous inhibitor of DNA gyrase (YacG/DUF329 family)